MVTARQVSEAIGRDDPPALTPRFQKFLTQHQLFHPAPYKGVVYHGTRSSVGRAFAYPDPAMSSRGDASTSWVTPQLQFAQEFSVRFRMWDGPYITKRCLNTVMRYTLRLRKAAIIDNKVYRIAARRFFSRPFEMVPWLRPLGCDGWVRKATFDGHRTYTDVAVFDPPASLTLTGVSVLQPGMTWSEFTPVRGVEDIERVLISAWRRQQRHKPHDYSQDRNPFDRDR